MTDMRTAAKRRAALSPEQRRERDKEIALRWLIGEESYSQIARRFDMETPSINPCRHRGEKLLPLDRESRLLLYAQVLERDGEELRHPYWEQLAERRDLICTARAEGATYKQIGDVLGVSKQAVWKLCVRAGI